NDPLFGKSTAAMFFKLKTTSYKFSFGASKDNLSLDSVVLVLNYVDTYGDSTHPQRLNVFEITQNSNFRNDSNYLLRSNPLSVSSLLGTAMVTPQNLDDSVHLFKEESKNQLRIRLDNTFGLRLLQYDSTNAYASDSAFKTYFKGFAVYPDSTFPGNALMGFSLLDTNTKLAIYFKTNNGGKLDTAVTYFRFTGLSASANLVNRKYTGSQLATYLDGSTPDNLLFIQNAPGSFSRLKIPGLNGMNNRVVHKAELIVQEVYDPTDRLFTPPTYLYIDAFDSVKMKYKAIPYDITFSGSGEINATTFGMIGKQTVDGSGNPIRIWRFDISRYIQHVLNRTETDYELRLHAPFTVRQLVRFGTTEAEQFFSINPTPVKGRVRVGGGNHASQPMKLRIIYSRI
ncbi:MAG: DUF4270 family protein, partial [Flavisolibacter sp.]|nr:DUF4270 family protein [Flavisolibacter sp.]